MTTININSIIRSAGTQFRVETSKDNIGDMKDLIQRGVKWSSPIRLARWNDSLYLVDGFHRVAAYLELDIVEIPVEQTVTVDANSIEEIRVLSAGANVAHGKGNTEADYHNIIVRLMELEDGAYMKNKFEPDLPKMTAAIGAVKRKMESGYRDYKGAASNPHPTLSQQCKEKRDRAIMEFHKAGHSDNAIAKLIDMTQSTVTRIRNDIQQAVMQNADSAKCITPVTPLKTPQANTEDRSDTRQDIAPWAEEQLRSLNIDLSEFSLTDDEDEDEDEVDLTPDFDFCAVTGFKPEMGRNKPAQQQASNDSVCLEGESFGRVDPQLLAKRKFLLSKQAEIAAQLEEVELQIAAQLEQQAA